MISIIYLKKYFFNYKNHPELPGPTAYCDTQAQLINNVIPSSLFKDKEFFKISTQKQ